ncbi:hypothetical protein ACFRCX_30765 [Streptomyces sp. NPDC056652]|uniref:hypothetical protein n=1 Tax=Streptomyces sp. NPDC056652 TaxID=3345893 RepID=UPI0036B7791F
MNANQNASAIPSATSDRVVIDVDRDVWTKGLQLNIVQLDDNNSGWGYRLAGPKYNGSSKNLLRRELDERDVKEIRTKLDAVFPVPGTLSPFVEQSLIKGAVANALDSHRDDTDLATRITNAVVAALAEARSTSGPNTGP